MKGTGAILVLWATFFGNGCSKTASDSVVYVTVTAPVGLPPVTQLRVNLAYSGRTDTELFPSTNSTKAISFAPAATFVLDLPHSSSGSIDIAIDALSAAGSLVSHGENAASIVAGGRTNITVVLGPGNDGRDGGLDSGTSDTGVGIQGDASISDSRLPDTSTRDVGGVGGTTATGTGGATGAGGSLVIGAGGKIGSGGVPGTGGSTVGSGGNQRTGGATTADAGSGGSGGGVSGTGGATGGTTGGSDAALPPGDAPANCLGQIISNGYACGTAPACSACMSNGTSAETKCQAAVDCLAAAYPCTGGCALDCLNKTTYGDSVVQSCVTALQTAACSVSGCGSAPTGTTVVFGSGKTQGAMTGYGWVDLGSSDTITDPTCGAVKAQITSASPCVANIQWSATDKLCITGSAPALPAAPTAADLANNSGIAVGVNSTDPAGGGLGQSFLTITIAASGVPTSTVRAQVHVKGDPNSTSYCMTYSTLAMTLAKFATDCYNTVPTGLLAAANIPNIDKVSLAAVSGSAAVTVTNMCITGIFFQK